MSPTFLLGDNLLPNEAKYGFQQCQRSKCLILERRTNTLNVSFRNLVLLFSNQKVVKVWSASFNLFNRKFDPIFIRTAQKCSSTTFYSEETTIYAPFESKMA